MLQRQLTQTARNVTGRFIVFRFRISFLLHHFQGERYKDSLLHCNVCKNNRHLLVLTYIKCALFAQLLSLTYVWKGELQRCSKMNLHCRLVVCVIITERCKTITKKYEHFRGHVQLNCIAARWKWKSDQKSKYNFIHSYHALSIELSIGKSDDWLIDYQVNNLDLKIPKL